MKLFRVMSAQRALRIAEMLNGMTWGEGKARNAELTGTTKRNLEILPRDNPEAAKLSQAIGTLIREKIALEAIPKKVWRPKFSKYTTDDMEYQRHTDAPWMGEVRTDLSCTLWLNDGYEGGELVVESPIGEKRYKGAPGEALLYECGNVHRVTPVTSGERICAVTWVQSRIRDPQKRRVVSELRRLLADMEENGEWFLRGGRIQSALLRMWSE